MRIVCTLNHQKQAQALSTFLTAEGIENQLDISKETDWGSPSYGDVTCRIWIIDEDQVEAANQWVDLFKQDPNNPIFAASHKSLFSASEPAKENPLKRIKLPSPTPAPAIEPIGTITLYILLLCTFIFLITEITEPPTIKTYPAELPAMPLVSAPLKKKLLYDYPYTFELVDKLVNLYGLEQLQEPSELPAEGKALIQKIKNTPYWQGYYDLILNKLQGTSLTADAQAPMFEKLRQGEFWRLISPCFLHSDILHILFNMIWLIILGKQLDLRLGAPRYLLFILLTGIFSNTAQYLMGGANFIGFSGVICAMLVFIWTRQTYAPWEGYQLEKSTMLFMVFFILSMFSLQLISFYFEANQQSPISPGIANTAHLSGAAMGYILAKLPFFKWKT